MTMGPGDKILAERARANDKREFRLWIGIPVALALTIGTGWLAWWVYDENQERNGWRSSAYSRLKS